MWRLWPLFKRLWAAVGTVAAGLAVKDLIAVWTKQSVPEVERFSRFPLGHWYWGGGGADVVRDHLGGRRACPSAAQSAALYRRCAGPPRAQRGESAASR